MSQKLMNFIGGNFCEPSSGRYLPVMNPAKNERIAEVADSNAADIDRAVESAQAAFPAWAALPARQRAAFLRKIAQGIEADLAELSRLESLNTGKPLKVSKHVDIPRSAHNFEFFADALTQWSSESHASDEQTLNYTLRAPLGVVACISPWNLPLYLFTWKIAPALAAGNCVVAKPSEITPWTATRLAQIAHDAGLPAGVLNIVHGSGSEAGSALCGHAGVKAISFTGSTRVGAEIARIAAPQFKKYSLELGGKNATLVFADCDFERTVRETARAAFSNQGQICLCGSRILVERSLYPRFRDALVQEVRKLKVGDPFAADTDQGSLVSQAHFEKVVGCLDRARREGGRILCGGQRASMKAPFAGGFFLEPTLIEGLPTDCLTNQEEIFGPVATLAPFESEAEALQAANGTRYGLAASVWTRDLSRAHRVAARLQAGLVWVNTWMHRDLRTPFGGVKESGVGREGGLDAFRFFTESKNVCIHYPEGSTP